MTAAHPRFRTEAGIRSGDELLTVVNAMAWATAYLRSFTVRRAGACYDRSVNPAVCGPTPALAA